MEANVDLQPCLALKEDSITDQDLEIVRCVLNEEKILLDVVLSCKAIGAKCTLPIASANCIIEAIFPSKTDYVDLAGHKIFCQEATRFLTPDLFPIDTVDELVSVLHVAFARQKEIQKATCLIESFRELQCLKSQESHNV